MKLLPVPEILIGECTIENTVSILNDLMVDRVLVVTDQGIVKAGIYDQFKSILQKGSIEIVLFDRVQPDPGIDLVRQSADLARSAGVKAVIGLGGGSSLDTAKVAAALVTNPKDVTDYIGIDLLKKSALPIIAIPTTAGTGSEVTPIAILSDEVNQLKKAIVSAKMMPRYAILDPRLTVSLPPMSTVFTGMDALIHAMESFTSIHANSYSEALGLKAIDLISRHIRLVFHDGENLKARESMLLGSLLAGMAFANVGVAAAHAFAYPLGGIFHIPHGLSTSLMLIPVMSFNLPGNEEKYRLIAQSLSGKPDVSAHTALDEIEKLFVDLNLPRNLQAVNVPETALPIMAAKVMDVTRLLGNNPRKVTPEDALAIYQAAYAR